MRKFNVKKAVAGVSAAALIFTAGTVIPNYQNVNFVSSITASAATISRNEINESNMFFVQDRNNNCTHASITMLLKRVSRINGGNYSSITQDSTRSTVWGSNGAVHDLTYDGMRILYCNKEAVYNQLGNYNGSRKELFKALLKQHPEGIVVYDSWHRSGSGDKPSLWYSQAPAQVADDYSKDHAILLTDYDQATDTFYAADPANSSTAKRIPLSQTTRAHIDYFDTYWYYTGTLKNSVSNSGTSTPEPTRTKSSGTTTYQFISPVEFRNVTYPINQPAGGIFNVYGKINTTNNSKITKITVDIDEYRNGSYYNVDRTVRYPNTTTYDLHTIDDRIWFNRASKKNTTYRYRIIVEANGKTCIYSKSFKTF